MLGPQARAVLAAAESRSSSRELVQAAIPADVDPVPGMTVEQAEELALTTVGLGEMNPSRRYLEELHPAWADPKSWSSCDKLKQMTGYDMEVTHAVHHRKCSFCSSP